MRLGSGLSSVGKSPVMSCFDVDLYAEEDLSSMPFNDENDLFALFGFSDDYLHCGSKMDLL